jgi:hypothetical protein
MDSCHRCGTKSGAYGSLIPWRVEKNKSTYSRHYREKKSGFVVTRPKCFLNIVYILSMETKLQEGLKPSKTDDDKPQIREGMSTNEAFDIFTKSLVLTCLTNFADIADKQTRERWVKEPWIRRCFNELFDEAKLKYPDASKALTLDSLFNCFPTSKDLRLKLAPYIGKINSSGERIGLQKPSDVEIFFNFLKQNGEDNVNSPEFTKLIGNNVLSTYIHSIQKQCSKIMYQAHKKLPQWTYILLKALKQIFQRM